MLKLHTLSRSIRRNLPVIAASTGLLLTSPTILAQEEQADDANTEQIVITGSRGAPRSVADSAVPVDVFSEEDLVSVPFTDTNDILKTLVPSYSLSRQPISDGASFIRPATLRGMPTDKTLVLVNSKRRHRSALVQIGGSGTQGPDIATIPSSALKGVEVLRDGAAAQYGSDAIAGVINFQLKDNDEGGSLSIDMGQYYEGDGEQFTVTGNIGFALGDKGFVSVSGEISDQSATSRSEQYCESWACVDSDSEDFLNFDTSVYGYDEAAYIEGLADANIGFGDVVQPWGQPNSAATRLFINSGYEINDTTRLYAFGNYSSSEHDGGFFYRYPGNGTIETLRLEDGSLYSPLEKFPGGFTPRFFGDITDFSFVAGIEGEFANEMTYDFSGRFGSNEISYTLKNTINPSLADESPTEFHPGDLINEELQLTADFTQYVDFGMANEVLFAFGASYMEETYELVEGDEDSYKVGDFSYSDTFDFCNDDGSTTADGQNVIDNFGSSLDCSNPDDPVYTSVSPGSNGFPGYSPEYSQKYTRDSLGVYLDVSTDVTDAFFIQGALRYEDYSDFDAELVGKIAFKYSLTDEINVRGSVGTGFRAPTPGQQGTINVSTRLPDGFPVATGLFPALSAEGQALGAEPLRPETSENLSLGMSGSFDDLTLTIDFYRIAVDDRFYAVSTRDVSSFEPTDPNDDDYESDLAAYENYQALLLAAGEETAGSIGGVNFFQNAFDTVTSGVDIVATYTLGDTVLTGSVNYNSSTINNFGSEELEEFLNDEGQYDFENSAPKWKGVFSAKHSFDALSVLVRANLYGSYSNAIDSAATNVQEYDPSVLFDLEMNYALSDSLTLAAGARNLFDTYPDEGDSGDACCGRVYWSGDTVDWQGGYYYARLNYTW
ncbi:TonB-dependent receptor plug domain-containing protein [Paraglaciecola marina]|uniref:TonB-dependent receptor plug domain-containing protein n=1 Tax=Paraglaciecola marina TaxID=2500157 RepID=UPI0010614AD8|nr:TonB-dependent receptor [Paraglaciecola marina]